MKHKLLEPKTPSIPESLRRRLKAAESLGDHTLGHLKDEEKILVLEAHVFNLINSIKEMDVLLAKLALAMLFEKADGAPTLPGGPNNGSGGNYC